jgi:hypothetical protein
MISENASQTQPARMLAIVVLDTGDMPLCPSRIHETEDSNMSLTGEKEV